MAPRRLAPRRPLSPFVLRAVLASPINQGVLCRAAGFRDHPSFYVLLRSPIIIASDLTVSRLMKLAELLDFPKDQIFLDEPLTPRRKANDARREAADDAEAR